MKKLIAIMAVAVGMLMMAKPKSWQIPDNAFQYLALFNMASAKYKLPPKLLLRVAYQESHFNPNAKNKKSGATGMMQIIPEYHPDVDATSPREAIPYAAKYLRKLYDQFGSWRIALIAYNWGPGNTRKWLNAGGNIHTLPAETLNYYKSILKDTR